MDENKKLANASVYLDQNNLFFRYKRLDFKKLLDIIKQKVNVTRAISYMALDNKQEAQKKFITYLVNNGWKCNTIDISINTNIDGILISDMMNYYQVSKTDWIVLVSGDGDYSYTLNLLAQNGAKILVIGAKEYISIELLKIADDVLYLESLDGVILDNK